MSQGRPNEAERLLLDYIYDHKPDRTLDLTLDEAPFAEFAHARSGGAYNFRKAVERLAGKGALHRLQHGRYVASRERGPARSPRLQAFDPVAEVVLRRLQVEYYLSWHSALWHHGLIDQQSRRIYVAIRREKRPVQIGLAEVLFVRVTERKFFGWEIDEDFEWPVRVATVEKALLDSFDRPRLAAPVPVVADAMRRAWRAGNLNPERLVRAVERFGGPTVARRVGFFMDLYEIPGSEPLTLRLGRGYAVPLVPGHTPPPGEQRVSPRWRVYEDPALIGAALEMK
ncbi:MAG: type IV toxin-antitoxin system AbiEi family antitoxin [Solirubrobacteraceae bacterium]